MVFFDSNLDVSNRKTGLQWVALRNGALANEVRSFFSCGQWQPTIPKAEINFWRSMHNCLWLKAGSLDFFPTLLLLQIDSLEALRTLDDGRLRKIPAVAQFFQGLRLLEFTLEALERLINGFAVFDFCNQHKFKNCALGPKGLSLLVFSVSVPLASF
jgi:hypothetical protein